MSQIIQRIKSVITIPDYFSKFIDNKIDLRETHLIGCPFHDDSKPSFTYSPEKDLWRCWSGPNCGGGDVIVLHQRNYHLKTKEDAVTSLAEMFGLTRLELDLSNKVIQPDDLIVKMISYTAKADRACKSIEDYVNLDFIMSQKRPIHEMIKEIENFLKMKGVFI